MANLSLSATRTELDGRRFGIMPAKALDKEATLRTRIITVSTSCTPGDVVVMALPSADTQAGEADTGQPREFVIAQISPISN